MNPVGHSSRTKVGGGDKPAKVLVIYTGGTIGMVREKNGLAPAKNRLSEFIHQDPQIHDDNYFLEYNDNEHLPFILPYIQNLKRVSYEILEYNNLLDSSNMGMSDWITIANNIKDKYKLYDGFVILHGTDTLAYTSSALSFMLENLGKPVIVTGSQVPILDPINDGKNNFVCSVAIAGNFHIPEVTVFFNYHLYRGNRISKVNTKGFEAFESYNYSPIAKVGTSFQVDYRFVLQPSAIAEFSVHSKLSEEVCLLKIYPGITADAVKSLLQPPVKGVVIQSYGAGNMPTFEKAGLIRAFQSAVEQEIIVVNITQCPAGEVSTAYEAGKLFYDIGVVPGFDMTPEAALSKLSYVLSKDEWDFEEKKKKMVQSLRGELSGLATTPFDELDLVTAVSQYLKLTSTEEKQHLKSVLIPSIVIDAVVNANISKLQDLSTWGADFNLANVDKRTPLHIACYYGNIEVVRFLLANGSNIHIRDSFGNVPLVEAVHHSPNEVIRLLVANGGHLSMDEKELGIELCNSAARGQIEKLKRYVIAGANMDLPDLEGRTPLHVACLHEQVDVVRFLLHKGVHRDKLDMFGRRPIDYARHTRNEVIIESLRGLYEFQNKC